jgi:hypothetical protein
MFLFRATHGENLTGSSSFASQTTPAAGRYIVNNPIRSSERYELTATPATSLNQGRTERPVVPAIRAGRSVNAPYESGWSPRRGAFAQALAGPRPSSGCAGIPTGCRY